MDRISEMSSRMAETAGIEEVGLLGRCRGEVEG
jgi:hypothetical protein